MSTNFYRNNDSFAISFKKDQVKERFKDLTEEKSRLFVGKNANYYIKH